MRSIENFISVLAMGLKIFFSIFFIILSCFFYLSESISCVCTQMSHEEGYCDSDFTMKVIVQSIEDKEGNHLSYSVEVLKIFEKNDGKNKVNDNQNFNLNRKDNDLKKEFFEMKTVKKIVENSKKINLNNNEFFLNDKILMQIYTPKDISACGRRLKVGKTYVISGWFDGNKARTSSCYYAKEPQEMTLKETFFFLLDYKNKDCRKSNKRHPHGHHHPGGDGNHHHGHHHHHHTTTQKITTAATIEEPCDETTATTTEEPCDDTDQIKKEENAFPKKPELQAKPFVCPKEDISRGCKGSTECLYPNPSSCYTFIQCVPKPDGSGTPVVKVCPPGLEWNDRKKECDWPQFSTCLKNSH